MASQYPLVGVDQQLASTRENEYICAGPRNSQNGPVNGGSALVAVSLLHNQG